MEEEEEGEEEGEGEDEALKETGSVITKDNNGKGSPFLALVAPSSKWNDQRGSSRASTFEKRPPLSVNRSDCSSLPDRHHLDSEDAAANRVMFTNEGKR